MKRVYSLFAALILGSSAALFGQGFLDAELGAAFTGYNDVRIPADSATLISLKEDISSEPALAMRLRAGYTFADRHTIMALLAPLTVRGNSTLDRTVSYQGATFLSGTKVHSQYRFDSYRLSYRYAMVKNEALTLSLGLTGKIRSADIAIMSDTAYAHRSDLGVVPLISAMVQWTMAEPFSLLLDADALWSPFGRAEDVLLALQYHPSDSVAFRLGYRLLEGGSDGGGNVYTFSLFHYVSAGISLRF